jgi:DNA-damage-inducible protein J
MAMLFRGQLHGINNVISYISEVEVMGNTVTVSARIDHGLKKEVDSIFKSMGISATEAITMFYHMVKLKKKIPFDEKIPNKETIQIFKDTDAGKNLNYCKSFDEMFKELDI